MCDGHNAQAPLYRLVERQRPVFANAMKLLNKVRAVVSSPRQHSCPSHDDDDGRGVDHDENGIMTMMMVVVMVVVTPLGYASTGLRGALSGL